MKVYTLNEAAELMNVHRQTIGKAINAGELKAMRLAHEYRISDADLEDWYRRGGGGTLRTDTATGKLITTRDEGGLRQCIDSPVHGRVPLFAGASLEYLSPEGWIGGRYEWAFKKDREAELYSNDTRQCLCTIPDGSIVRKILV